MSALPLKADICTRGRNPENRQAVIRLVTGSNIVGCSIGRSADSRRAGSVGIFGGMPPTLVDSRKPSSEQIQFDAVCPVNAGGQKTS
jgi:hypothetical protein